MPDPAAVPDGWQAARLGDVASIRREQVRPAGGDSRLYVALEHIDSAGSLNGYGTASDSISNKTVFCKGDTLYGKLRPNLRKVIRAEVDGVCSTDILAVFAREGADGPFLSQLLRSNLLHAHAMRGVAGTKMPRTSWNHLRTFTLPIPPLAEQRAIAAVLDAIDEAIERTEEVIAATERLRDALLHELLTRGLPGRHSEWADVPGLGTVPACWDVVRLGDVLSSTTYGTNVPLDGSGSTPILRMNNLQGGKIDLSEVRHAELPDRERGLNLVSGDILFNRTNSLDLVGKVAVVRDDLPQPISFASYLVRLRVRESQADGFWLASLLGSPSCQARIRRLATPAVSQANINPTSLRTLTIPLPRIEEQQVIAAALDGVDGAIERAREERAGLHSLQASTADALLTGRVRVPL